MLSAAPARAIAKWAATAMRETGCRNLIEIGPGEGKLSAAVLENLPWLRRRRTRLHLVEISSPLAEVQRKLLGNKPDWHDSPAKALAACDGEAVIFSNELVDAFPVRRFQKTPDGWLELAVHRDAAGLVREVLMPAAPLPESSGFSDDHTVGQRVEVHDSYHRWLAGWLPLWKAGRLLTIDYGATADVLYQRRPAGTVRAYLLQQRLEGAEIYQNPGRQDLTADVNFTDLMNWSAPFGMTARLRTAGEFLLDEIDPENPVDRDLTNQHGAGGAFLVLDQDSPAR